MKEKLLAGVDPSELVNLRFSRSDAMKLLDWEHAAEFRYLGQSYDVVRVEEYADSVTYVCWWDKAESKLNNELDQLVAQALSHDPPSKDKSKTLLSILKLPYSAAAFDWQAMAGYTLQQSRSLFFNNYKPLKTRPLVPPPIAKDPFPFFIAFGPGVFGKGALYL